MSDIRSGDVIATDWWPRSRRVFEGTDQLNITSTSFTAGSPECSVTFSAPNSGRVGVVVAAEMRNDDTGGNRVFVTYELYLGSSSAGTLVRSAQEENGVSTTGDTTASEYMIFANLDMVDGLTPEATYFIRAMHRVAGGTTNDIGFRRLVVFPMA